MTRVACESDEKRAKRLEYNRAYQSQRLANETDEQHANQLQYLREYQAKIVENETEEEREIRLLLKMMYYHEQLDKETPSQKEARLKRDREKDAEKRASIQTYKDAFWIFADRNCEICTKRCYPNQVANYRIPVNPPAYLPDELKVKQILVLCHTCKKHLQDRKKDCHPKSYWNKLDPGQIPDVFKVLSRSEKSLLSRIDPFVKVIKYDGIFGQYGFKGQAVLFAKDIFEVTEKLPVLPRSTLNSNIIVVTEELENINITKEYNINRETLYAALKWLVENNMLYSDVIIDEEARLNQLDLVRKALPANLPVEVNNEENELNEADDSSAYVEIYATSRIVRANFHQGSDFLNSEHAGRQCCAMALASIARAIILPPQKWKPHNLDTNLIEGNDFYNGVVRNTNDNPDSIQIAESGYLLIRNFDTFKNDFIMYGEAFSMDYALDPELFGNLQDSRNANHIGLKLNSGLRNLFREHTAGILIAGFKSYAVFQSDDKFYFADSHSCGAKGVSAGMNGKACVIQCDNIEELTRICQRATGKNNLQYTLDYMDVNHKKNPIGEAQPMQAKDIMENIASLPAPVLDNDNDVSLQVDSIPLQTSVMAPIDFAQPDVEDELCVTEDKIIRKTKDNIVNERHEHRAEEFAWWYLFPYGINGLREIRDVQISPLQYFQSRILGSDKRFQRNDYLFYALSMVEYLRISSSISACGKKIEGQNGQVDDVHLLMKNIRGTASYWNTGKNDLIGMIRTLGGPTYFITLSCNDLNWGDMKKALLIEDGQPDVDQDSIDIFQAQALVEKYPVVVSRHFNKKIELLIQFLSNNAEVLGGKLKYYWGRVEIQNRGSPHWHMIVWIEDHPKFDSPEGKALIDKICTCALPDKYSPLHDIVKKTQVHKHTQTCYKNGSTTCRFAFPRRECSETKIIATNSDDFIRTGGRIVELKRRKGEEYINNYNLIVLIVWEGNMDIQPCGDNESIANYVTKYISKAEPDGVTSSIAAAIRKIREEESNISTKLFKVCMRLMKERQVSACECVYRLCNLKLRRSSTEVIFLNTRRPEQRYRVCKFDKTGVFDGYCLNIFDRYVKRPRQHPDYDFENMSLTEFAMEFRPHYSRPIDEDEESVDNDAIPNQNNVNNQLIVLLDDSKMKIRGSKACIRVPKFNSETDPHNYYYSLLMQYMPFRDEAKIIQGFDSARDAFVNKEEELKARSTVMDEFRRRDMELENAFTKIQAFELLDEIGPIADDLEDADFADDRAMNDTEFQNALQAMNIEQRRLYNHITQSIQDQQAGSLGRLKIFVTGGAGTGKTFTLNVCKNQIIRCYGNNSNVIKIGSLTGVAARLVNGQTLHSLFKLPVQKDGKNGRLLPLTGNYLKIMRNQWRDVEFMIIDEISMVPFEMLCMIETRLRQLKNNEDGLFGGVNILVFGDLFQLPPIKGHQVFKQPNYMQPAIHLWRCFSLCELMTNMRQQGDNTFVDILNALRIGELLPEHMKVLLEHVTDDFTEKFSKENALRIYATRAKVEAHNTAVVEHFKAKAVEMITVQAQDRIIDSRKTIAPDKLNKMISKDVNRTGALEKEITIFNGAKVMLRSNVDVSKGLVNGAIGNITAIIWPYFRRAQLDAREIPSVKIEFEGGVGNHLIQPITKEFPALGSFGTVERRMLPIVLCYATTSHKMQGGTLDLGVADLSGLFAKGQAYVMLSRFRSLDGLKIENINPVQLTGKKPCNTDALEEMERMRNLPPAF